MSVVLPITNNSGGLPLLLRFPVKTSKTKLEGTVGSNDELEEKLKKFIEEQFAEIRKQIKSQPASKGSSAAPKIDYSTFDYDQLNYKQIVIRLKQDITNEIKAYLSNPTNFTTIINIKENKIALEEIIKAHFKTLSAELKIFIDELRKDTGELKRDTGDLKSLYSILNTKVKTLDTRIKTLEAQLDGLRTLQTSNNDSNRSVISGHETLIKQQGLEIARLSDIVSVFQSDKELMAKLVLLSKASLGDFKQFLVDKQALLARMERIETTLQIKGA